MTKPSYNNEHGGHYFCTQNGEGCIEYPLADVPLTLCTPFQNEMLDPFEAHS